MKKSSIAIYKVLFKVSFIVSLVSLIIGLVLIFSVDNYHTVPRITKCFFVLGIAFGFLSIILFVFTPRPQTACNPYKVSFDNFEDAKICFQNSLKKQHFKAYGCFKTQYGYEVFVFKKGVIRKENFFVVKINHYAGIDSLNDIPAVLIQKFAFGFENMSWSIKKNAVVLCFNEKDELWYSDFLNITDPSNNHDRYFWTALDLSQEQLHVFEYRDNVPYEYYEKMRKHFLKILE